MQVGTGRNREPVTAGGVPALPEPLGHAPRARLERMDPRPPHGRPGRWPLARPAARTPAAAHRSTAARRRPHPETRRPCVPRIDGRRPGSAARAAGPLHRIVGSGRVPEMRIRITAPRTAPGSPASRTSKVLLQLRRLPPACELLWLSPARLPARQIRIRQLVDPLEQGPRQPAVGAARLLVATLKGRNQGAWVHAHDSKMILAVRGLAIGFRAELRGFRAELRGGARSYPERKNRCAFRRDLDFLRPVGLLRNSARLCVSPRETPPPAWQMPRARILPLQLQSP